MISMLMNIFTDIAVWIKSWSPVVFTVVLICLVMFLALSTVAFIKKAVSDKPAVKIGKILVIAILVFLIIYVCSTH